MTTAIHSLVELIHASPTRTVVAVAGAGGQALAWLLNVPGASQTVLEAIVPYGGRSMAEFLRHDPAQYVSTETASDMAASAYRRALKLREAGEPVVGLGCTATIATDRAKRGGHRCCVASWEDLGVTTYNLKLAKGQRDRLGEEDVVSRLVLHALAQACGINRELPLGLLPDDRLEVEHTDHDGLLRQFLAGVGLSSQSKSIAPTTESPASTTATAEHGQEPRSEVRTVTVHPDGHMAVNEPVRAGVLPGSFSPLHQGHERLALVASEMLGEQVVLEISVTNVDKPPLDEQEVRRRICPIHGRWCVVLTRAPTFREKAVLFPGCTFVIGWDTAVRLVDPSYHGEEEAAVKAALGRIRAAECRFLVAGRFHDGVYRTLADVAIPQEFTDLFEPIPESRFRFDSSSTELRTVKPRGRLQAAFR